MGLASRYHRNIKVDMSKGTLHKILPNCIFFNLKGLMELMCLEGPIILSIRMRDLIYYCDLEITFNDV